MLNLIEIKGFRSFSQESFQQIKLRPFTVIVGENDTGKSNILKAIQFALAPSTDNIVEEDFNIRKSKLRTGRIGDKKSSKITIKLYFNNVKKLLPKKYQRKSYHSNDESFVIQCVASGHNKNTYKKQYRLNNKPIDNKSVPVLLSKIRYFITPSIRDVNHLNELKEFLPIEKSSLITQAVKKFIEVVRDKVKEQEAIIKKATNAEKAIIDPVVDSQGVLKLMDFDFTIVKDAIPIQLKSHGQGMISKIILSNFLHRGKNYFVGIEEPEIHIHPNLIREIISLCEKMVKKETQIIIVTHSPYFVNFVRTENILVVRKDNKYTKTYSLANFTPAVSSRIETNIFLNRQKAEILFAKGAILVEGPYDRIIFTLVDFKEKIRTFEQGVSIIDVGGDTAFGVYIELCIKSEIPWVVVGDRKAFYSPNGDKKGPALEAIKNYVNEPIISNFLDKIKHNINSKNELNEINEVLKTKRGAIFNLSGDDISDTIINILREKKDDNLYKKLNELYGGHSNEYDIGKIKDKVEKTIEKGRDEMLTAMQHIDRPNELEKTIKSALCSLRREG